MELQLGVEVPLETSAVDEALPPVHSGSPTPITRSSEEPDGVGRATLPHHVP
jgi:hypothetical protein